MTFTTASALDANKHQDQLVKTPVYSPFNIENTSKEKVTGKKLRWILFLGKFGKWLLDFDLKISYSSG